MRYVNFSKPTRHAHKQLSDRIVTNDTQVQVNTLSLVFMVNVEDDVTGDTQLHYFEYAENYNAFLEEFES